MTEVMKPESDCSVDKGGPSKKWTSETMSEAILYAIREGASLADTARKYGIPLPTFVLYAKKVHELLGPSTDESEKRERKCRGRPRLTLVGKWPQATVDSAVRAVVFDEGGAPDSQEADKAEDEATEVGAESSSDSSEPKPKTAAGTTGKAKRTFVCSYCGRVFSNGSNLIKHIRHHTGEKPYTCEICSATFSDPSHFKYHKSSHSQNRSQKCDQCPSSFIRKTDLASHVRNVHSKDKPFHCTVCDYKSRTKRHLVMHMIIHSDEKPYKCALCSQSYKRKSELNTHMMRHTGEKPYKCGECGAAFLRQKVLKVHLRTHTGERPYQCSHCDATFVIKSALDRHVLVHLGVKRFECGICHLKMADKVKLLDHMNIHTGERPHRCSQCPACFPNRWSLRRHAKKYHS